MFLTLFASFSVYCTFGSVRCCVLPISNMLRLRGSARFLSDINQSLLQNVSFRCQQVQCLRVGNTEIPNNKKLSVALQHIHGVGRRGAHQILTDLSIANKHTKYLTGIELNSLREKVSKYLFLKKKKKREPFFKYLTRPDLKQAKADIQRLVDIECYKGYRLAEGSPWRGLLTSTNAWTRKVAQNTESVDLQKSAERICKHQETSQAK